MQKSLSFNKGITTSPSDLLSDDTELSASRDLIFRNTQVLMLIVVDQMRELVTFYYHDITLPTTSTFREIKAAGKSSNPDIMEYIKAFQLASGARI